MRLLKIIRNNKWMLRSLAKTVYFNFHYLPLRQAVRLPIWLYKARLRKLGGSITITADRIRPGMIQLGTDRVSVYRNGGISLEINGDIVFRGSCYIGNDSFIAVDGGKLSFGDFFNATAAVRIVCRKGITFGDRVLLGWNNMVCDSDFHTVRNRLTGKTNATEKEIAIGSHVWIANGCSVMKGSEIPDNVIVAQKSLVNGKLDVPEYSLVAGTPAKLKKEDVDWDV